MVPAVGTAGGGAGRAATGAGAVVAAATTGDGAGIHTSTREVGAEVLYMITDHKKSLS